MLEPRDWKVLDVGTAGDPPRPDGLPGGNYEFFGEGNTYKTLDLFEQFKPDYVGDICGTKFKGSSWDLVILSNTLEHIYDSPEKAIKECFRIVKPNGFLIADSPWMYPYHAEKDFGDYWRMSKDCLAKMCEDAGFSLVLDVQTHNLSSVLVRKLTN